ITGVVPQVLDFFRNTAGVGELNRDRSVLSPSCAEMRATVNGKPVADFGRARRRAGVSQGRALRCLGISFRGIARYGWNTPLQSVHPGGANALRCTGSVTFLKESMLFDVLRWLCIRDGFDEA